MLNPGIFHKPGQKTRGRRGHRGRVHGHRRPCVPVLENIMEIAGTGEAIQPVPGVPASENVPGTRETRADADCPLCPRCPREKNGNTRQNPQGRD